MVLIADKFQNALPAQFCLTDHKSALFYWWFHLLGQNLKDRETACTGGNNNGNIQMIFKTTKAKKTQNRNRPLLGSGVILGAATLLLTAQMAPAGIVDLTSLDGNVQISGEIVGTSGQHFLLNNASGTFKIDSRLVTCAGLSCPMTSQSKAVIENASFQ